MFSGLMSRCVMFCSAALCRAEATCRRIVGCLRCVEAVAEASEQLLQVLTGDVLLGDVVPAVDAADLVNRDDVGVDELGGGLGLVMEAADVGLVAGERAAEHLDCHLPTERKLLGQIDFRHPAAAQTAQDLIVAQTPPDEVGFGASVGEGCGGDGGHG